MNTLSNVNIEAAPTRGFDDSEFKQRLVQAQTLMGKNAIGACLLTTEADIRYFSGFLTQFWQSPTRPWYLLLPQTGEPVAVIPSIGAACMGRTWIKDIRCWSSPDPDDDGISLLTDALQECMGRNNTLGIAMGRESYLRMPLHDYEKLKQNLHSCSWTDASPLLQTLRQVKSATEVEKIRHSCSLASTAFERLPEFLAAGMTEIEVFAIFKQLCLKLGVDDTSYVVGSSGSGGYGDIISPASQRPLQNGDVLILDTGCQWDGYFCDFDRNYSVGVSNDLVAGAYKVVWDATQAGLEFIKPGVTCAEVFHVMNNHMMPYALSNEGDVGRLGHGLGMQLTETPSFASFDQTIIQEGMVLTLEPGYTFAQGKMMVHEENIVIRPNGAELLSRRAATTMPTIPV